MGKTFGDNDREPARSFKTLRGAMSGEESDEPIYFAYSCGLRIFGDGLPLDEISERLGVQPTRVRRKGERPKPGSKTIWPDDGWFFSSSLPESEPLHRHIDAVWSVMKPRVEYLKALKERFKVDVFCGYRSNCDHAGIEVPPRSLEMFVALEIPFGVSIIVE
jgi:hypothetical protein